MVETDTGICSAVGFIAHKAFTDHQAAEYLLASLASSKCQSNLHILHATLATDTAPGTNCCMLCIPDSHLKRKLLRLCTMHTETGQKS